jgi:hypothetical protein
MTTEQAEQLETGIGLAETEDGMITLLVENLGMFGMPVSDWQDMWRRLGYQLRKRRYMEPAGLINDNS